MRSTFPLPYAVFAEFSTPMETTPVPPAMYRRSIWYRESRDNVGASSPLAEPFTRITGSSDAPAAADALGVRG